MQKKMVFNVFDCVGMIESTIIARGVFLVLQCHNIIPRSYIPSYIMASQRFTLDFRSRNCDGFGLP